MAPVRRLVLDVLKPHDPHLVAFTTRVADTESVAGVTGSVIELDEEVQNVKLTIEGEDVDYDAVEETVVGVGATVHSVDQVSAGARAVEDRDTPQD
jgi:hypothetical protein